MPILHIANTNFEFELKNNFTQNLETSLSQNALCLQLQFLPLFFAAEDDYILTTHSPSKEYLSLIKKILGNKELPHFITYDNREKLPDLTCISWGPSQQIVKWTANRNISYTIPKEWEKIKQVNSKAFSYHYSPLKESCLIFNFSDLSTWLAQQDYPKVLKTCFGLSATGHLIINQEHDLKKIEKFCQDEWNGHLPLIGEPWLKRVFDFSTQWYLSPDGKSQLLGSTVFQTRKNGGYLGTFAGTTEILFDPYLSHLYEHIEIAKKVLQDLFSQGYFGHIGIDALLYYCSTENKIKLYPVVEINGRKTLSYVALRFQQIHYPNQILYFAFEKHPFSQSGLLPKSLGSTTFKQNLIMKIIGDDKEIAQLQA